MNEEEIITLNKITEAHNLYVKLPVQHDSDTVEWCAAIHILQRIIMARSSVRQHPEIFKNKSGL